MTVFKKFSISYRIFLPLIAMTLFIGLNQHYILHSLEKFENGAFAINNLGVIRGTMQRAAKYACAKEDFSLLSSTIEERFDVIEENYISQTYNQPYFEHFAFEENYDALKGCWQKLQGDLLADNKDFDQLMATSEGCWQSADLTTLTAQRIEEYKQSEFVEELRYRILIILAIILLIIFVVMIYVRGYLEREVSRDPLTKLFNRKYFFEQMRELSALSDRYERHFSLIFIDIDYFKSINDRFGHQKGDLLLQQFSHLLESSLRRTDSCYRYGGEEFVVLAPETDAEQMLLFAERFRARVASEDFGLDETVTISLGVAEYIPGEGVDMVLLRADKAMYKAKEAGRNKVVVASS